MAAEYAVKARETYDELAEHGEEAVKTWRGEAADQVVDIAAAIEPEPEAGEPAEARVAAERQARSGEARRPRPSRPPARRQEGRRPSRPGEVAAARRSRAGHARARDRPALQGTGRARGRCARPVHGYGGREHARRRGRD